MVTRAPPLAVIARLSARGRQVVGDVRDDDGILSAEGEVERLHLAANALDGLARDLAALGAAVLADPCRLLRRCRKQ